MQLSEPFSKCIRTIYDLQSARNLIRFANSPPTTSERLNLARYCHRRSGPGASDAGRPVFCRTGHRGLHRPHGATTFRARIQLCEVEARILQIAGALRELDARPGDRFLLRLRHSPEFAFAFFGAIAAGLIAVPVSPQLTAAEVAFLIEDAEPAFVCNDPELPAPKATTGSSASPRSSPHWLELKDLTAGNLRPGERSHDGAAWSPTGPEDPAFLVYTSGTTGRPKGVLHAQRSVLGRRPMLAGWSGLGPHDRLLHAGQLN